MAQQDGCNALEIPFLVSARSDSLLGGEVILQVVVVWAVVQTIWENRPGIVDGQVDFVLHVLGFAGILGINQQEAFTRLDEDA